MNHKRMKQGWLFCQNYYINGSPPNRQDTENFFFWLADNVFALHPWLVQIKSRPGFLLSLIHPHMGEVKPV